MTFENELIDHLHAAEPTEHESASADAPHGAREHYIPIRKADLVAHLAQRPEMRPDEAEQFREMCRILESIFHFEYHQRLEELKSHYAPFDPDADTKVLEKLDGAELDRRSAAVFENFISLLDRGNFRRVGKEEIEEAMKVTSDWGVNLDIDFGVFRQFEIFARGDIIGTRRRRNWKTRWQLEEVRLPVYQRLAVIFRLRPHKRLDSAVSTEHIYVKLFKNVPKMDIEMLLPGVQVKMTMFDQGKIVGPALIGIGTTGYKIIFGGLLLAFSSVASILTMLGVLGGTVGIGARSFFGYMQTKNKYQLNLTRSLYYQNLDNNAGVFNRLIDEAEEQECREAMLAYWLLWKRGAGEAWTERRLDDEAEFLLEDLAGVAIDFEAPDALAKLKRLRLVDERPDGRVAAVPIHEALVRLDQAWDTYFEHYTPNAAG